MTAIMTSSEHELLLLRAALDSAVDAVAIADLAGQLTYVNPAFVRIWGLADREAALGRSAAEFWHEPGDAHEVIAVLGRDGHWEGTLIASCADGRQSRLRVSAHLVHAADGTPLAMMATFHDLGTLEAAERALIVSEAQLRESQRLARLGSWELDLVENHLTWSDEIFRIFEIDQSRFGASYEAFVAAVHPDDRALVDRTYAESVASRTPYRIQHRLLLADGRIKHVVERGETLYAPDGRPLRSIGTVQDVTERALADAAVEEARQFLQQLIDSVPLFVFWKDRDSRYLGCNQAFARSAGLADAAAIVGMTDDQLVWRAQAPLFRRDDHAVIESGAAKLRYVEPLTTPTGETLWIETSKVPLRGRDGRVNGVLGVFQDVSERMAITAALETSKERLRQVNRDLEQHVAERTAELARERNFIDTVLDIAGALVIVLDRNGRVVRFNKACESVTGFRYAELAGQPFWDTLLPEEERAGVKGVFATLTASALPSTFENHWLTRDGDRRLIAWSNSVITDAAGAVLHVIGTGIDITEQRQAQLALIEARDVAERASRAKSDFLGRMSHELRTPMNAILGFAQLLQLDVTEERQRASLRQIFDAGTRLLGMINGLLELAPTAAGTDTSRSGTATRAKVRRVLYVEDNAANVSLMRRVFALRPQWSLEVADSAEEGLEIARAAAPDLILLDIQLPGMNGIAAMRLLRADAATSHIPVVAVSADALPAQVAEATAAGFQHYITKPFDIAELLVTLDSLLVQPNSG
jgi:PAS domain S-box-containing protein